MLHNLLLNLLTKNLPLIYSFGNILMMYSFPMTGTSCRNLYGIFKTKKARNMAILYNLELNNIDAYIRNNDYVTFTDVKFIIDNLWLSHFIYDNVPMPITVNLDKYNYIYNYLKTKFSFFNLVYSYYSTSTS